MFCIGLVGWMVGVPARVCHVFELHRQTHSHKCLCHVTSRHLPFHLRNPSIPHPFETVPSCSIAFPAKCHLLQYRVCHMSSTSFEVYVAKDDFKFHAAHFVGTLFWLICVTCRETLLRLWRLQLSRDTEKGSMATIIR